MKILFVSSKNSQLGVAPFIRSQGESLEKEGIEVEYFTIGSKGIKGYIKGVGELRRHLKENKYDLIHAHYALCGWVAVLALPAAPVMVSYMGSDVYGDVDAQGKRTLHMNIILAKLLQPLVKRIIVKSRNLEEYVYMKKKTHIIPNGVNFERFKPMDQKECRDGFGLTPDGQLILFLGNPNDPRKNLKLLEAALALLPDLEYGLVTPFPIGRDDIPRYLNAADLLVLPSLLEGSPNVIKEAMACNCPIVGAEVGDVREVIDGTNGCHVVTHNAKEMAAAIRQALAYGKRTTGRKDIAHLEESMIAKKIIGIYKELIK